MKNIVSFQHPDLSSRLSKKEHKLIFAPYFSSSSLFRVRQTWVLGAQQ